MKKGTSEKNTKKQTPYTMYVHSKKKFDVIEDEKIPILARKIYHTFPLGFHSYLIVGHRGIGKTSYAMQCCYWALRKMGYTDAEAWDMVLDGLKFDIKSVVRFLEKALNDDEKQVFLLWDDCRVHASGSQYFINQRLCSKLSGLMDTARSMVCSLILTAPAETGILGSITSSNEFLIKCHYSEQGGWYRQYKGYVWATLPSGQKRIYKKYRDTISCYLPKPVFERYSQMRKSALQDVIRDYHKEEKKEDERYG